MAATTTKTTASFIIDFGSDDSAFLSAELDADKNNGRSTFNVEDTVYFRVYHSGNFNIVLSDPSTNLVRISSGYEEITDEIIQFVKTNIASTSKFITSLGTAVWFGNSYGSISKTNHQEIRAAGATENSVGVLSLNYSAGYESFSVKLPSVSGGKYHLLVYIVADNSGAYG